MVNSDSAAKNLDLALNLMGMERLLLLIAGSWIVSEVKTVYAGLRSGRSIDR
jgi:hypothetical protein